MPGFVQRQSSQVLQIAKTGAAGVAAVYLVSIGLFLLIPGPVMIASSNNPNFQSEFFKSHNDTQRTIGTVILCVAIFMIVGGSVLCCYVRKTSQNIQQLHQTQGVVISGGGAPIGPVTAGPVISGPGQGYVAVSQGPSAGYVPPPQPPGVYPPSQSVYPPPQPAYPPGAYPTGPAYPPPVQPVYPSSQPSVPSAPPPSYHDVTETN